MTAPWSSTQLGCLLAPIERPEPVDPARTYRILGARWYAQGLFVKDEKSGQNIKANTVYRVEAGDFIYNRLFAWKGSFAIAENEFDGCYVSNEFPCFAVNRDRLEPSYLKWWFSRESVWRQALDLSAGATPTSRNRLKEERLLRMEVPLPPLGEQRRIVGRIETLASKSEDARLTRALATKGLALLRLGHTNACMESLNSDACLGDVLTGLPRNGWSPHCDNLDDGTPVLTLSAVTGWVYDPLAFKRTSQPTNRSAHYWAVEGDLLVTRSNTPELVGHAAICNGFPNAVIYPDLMMKVPVDRDRASTRFVWYWLQSSRARDFIRLSAKGTSPTMKKISQSIVQQVPFPANLTLEEQETIVQRIDTLHAKADAVKALQAGTTIELDAMLPAILDKAFKGEL